MSSTRKLGFPSLVKKTLASLEFSLSFDVEMIVPLVPCSPLSKARPTAQIQRLCIQHFPIRYFHGKVRSLIFIALRHAFPVCFQPSGINLPIDRWHLCRLNPRIYSIYILELYIFALCEYCLCMGSVLPICSKQPEFADPNPKVSVKFSWLRVCV